MPPQTDEEIGRRLQQARTAAGFSVRQLAGRLGWPHTTLANYELGRRTLPVPRLYDIASALGRTPAALLVDPPEAAELVDEIAMHPERALQIRFVLNALTDDLPAAPE